MAVPAIIAEHTRCAYLKPMPARSTPFQKLVTHLQEQLALTASVTESDLLSHRLTGERREVDVVVRATVGSHTVVISMECIEQSRPADVTWVEKMSTKHAHLETNKLVLVSLKGFSEQALRLANKLGVSTYTPEEACAHDWTKAVGQAALFCARHDYTPLATSLLIDVGGRPLLFEVGLDTELFRPDTGAVGTLNELIMFLLQDGAFASRSMNSQTTDGTATIDTTFTMAKHTYATDLAGTRHLILEVHARIRAVRRSAPIPMTSIGWEGVPAAFGSAITPLGSTTLTVVEPNAGQKSAKIVVDGKALAISPYEPTPASGAVRFRTEKESPEADGSMTLASGQ